MEAQQSEKEDKASKLVTKWLGVNCMNSLLNMAGFKNKEELNATVSVYSTLANVEKATRLSLFQAVIDALLDKREIKGFSVMITMTMFNRMLSMRWDTTSVDST